MPDTNTPETFTRRQEATGGLRIIVAGLIWGLIPIFLRLTDGSTAVKAWVRVMIAALFALGSLLISRRMHELRKLGWRKIGAIAVNGLILGLNWIFFLYALDGAGSVALGELLGYTSPIIIAILAPIFLKEKFDPKIFIAIAAALIGFTFILAPHGFALTGETLYRALMGFCSAITVTILTLRTKKVLVGVPADAFMVVENTTAALALLPFAVLAIARGEGPTGLQTWTILVLGLGLLCTGIASIIYLEGFRRIRADHVAVLSYTEPVSAILYTAAVPLFAPFIPALAKAFPPHSTEPITLLTVLGVACVVGAGIYVMSIERRSGIESISPETAAEPLEQLQTDTDAGTNPLDEQLLP